MINDKKFRPSVYRYSVALVLTSLMAVVLAGCNGEQRFEAREALGFTLPMLDGSGTLSLSDYRGEVVYLTFWASWCVPCRQEMPYLAQLWERHYDKGFRVIAINVDEDLAAALEFAAEQDVPFPLVRDEGRVLSKQYKVPGFPTHYLLDRRGRIRYSGLGFNLKDVAAVSQEVETLLAESAGAAD
ncbi:MAG: TlpA family protein disulfide reductase [Proteobacteria bacterium]|nr:TlpA family protein disulfide reductase [Pseudomonadota bacterium]